MIENRIKPKDDQKNSDSRVGETDSDNELEFSSTEASPASQSFCSQSQGRPGSTTQEIWKTDLFQI